MELLGIKSERPLRVARKASRQQLALAAAGTGSGCGDKKKKGGIKHTHPRCVKFAESCTVKYRGSVGGGGVEYPVVTITLLMQIHAYKP